MVQLRLVLLKKLGPTVITKDFDVDLMKQTILQEPIGIINILRKICSFLDQLAKYSTIQLAHLQLCV